MYSLATKHAKIKNTFVIIPSSRQWNLLKPSTESFPRRQPLLLIGNVNFGKERSALFRSFDHVGDQLVFDHGSMYVHICVETWLVREPKHDD